MPPKILTPFLCLGLIVGWYSPSAMAQDWIPKKIVGLQYDELAATAKIQGEVEVSCIINPDGTVALSKVISTPHQLLVKSVEENAKKWVFSEKSGSGTKGTVLLKYTFVLEGESDRPQSQFVFEYPDHVVVTREYWKSIRP
jgi:TonB family protein